MNSRDVRPLRINLSPEQKDALTVEAKRRKQTQTRVVEEALTREFAMNGQTWPDNDRRIA